MSDYKIKLIKFIGLSKLIKSKCLLFPDVFKNSQHTTINHSGSLIVNMYFNDNYKTWCFYCGNFEYSNIANKVSIANDYVYEEKHLEEAIKECEDILKTIEYFHSPKKRKLNFN